MRCSTRHIRMGAIAMALLGVAASTILAQYALDANLQVGGRRVNPAANRMPIQRDIYRVNRRTGTMMYDEAAAFGVPAYNPSAPRQRPIETERSYHQPVLRASSNDVFRIDRRTGTFVYNDAYAFEAPSYSAYQGGSRPVAIADPVNAGEPMPTYRPARGSRPRGAVGQRISAPVGAPPATLSTPSTAQPQADSPPPGAANLTPQRYRPPRVPRGAERD